MKFGGYDGVFFCFNVFCFCLFFYCFICRVYVFTFILVSIGPRSAGFDAVLHLNAGEEIVPFFFAFFPENEEKGKNDHESAHRRNSNFKV